MSEGNKILLILSGGVALYKTLTLVSLLRKRHIDVGVVMTRSAQSLLSPTLVESIAGHPVLTDTLSVTGGEMDHIRLARDSHLILVAPATANLLAKMATGQGDDLATTVLLAASAPVFVAPAMNPSMWQHPATQANCAVLRRRGVRFIGPEEGSTACGEWGWGRMSEPDTLLHEITASQERPLKGCKILVTAGPTRESLDPVRFLTNASSGRQGYAMAQALARAGAEVNVVSGPTQETPPSEVTVHRVNTAQDMLETCLQRLPVDVALFSAAVCDWRVQDSSEQKIKNREDTLTLTLVRNPHIAQTLGQLPHPPSLMIGMCAETENLVEHAVHKRQAYGCRWLLGNHASYAGSDENEIVFVSEEGVEKWPRMNKREVARALVQRVVAWRKAL